MVGAFLIRGDEAVPAGEHHQGVNLAAVLKEVGSGLLQLERLIPILARGAPRPLRHHRRAVHLSEWRGRRTSR
jgi:hypothetical protein